MTASNVRLVRCLLSQLERKSRVSVAEATIDAGPAKLVRAGHLELGRHESDHHAGRAEALSEQMGGPDEAKAYSLGCLATLAARLLRQTNGLERLDNAVPDPFVGIGVLRRRGLTLPVVSVGDPPRGAELALLGLRQYLPGDGLIVLVPRAPRWSLPPRSGVAVLELIDDRHGHLHLERALDILDPGYRERAATDPALDLDFVRLTFATRADRHVLLINGHDFGGFRKSNTRFLRLLLLATARKKRTNDGWMNKLRLRDGSERDRALQELREELLRDEVPGIDKAVLRSLVKGRRRTGFIRLAVPPENITFDSSLASLSWVAPATRTIRNGRLRGATIWELEGLRTAELLLGDCRRSGTLPGPHAVQTPP